MPLREEKEYFFTKLQYYLQQKKNLINRLQIKWKYKHL